LVSVNEKFNYGLDVDEAIKKVDENTIGVVAIMGSTFTGHFDPVKELNDKLQVVNDKNGWSVPIHVDGASGAFVAPFLYPDVEWDFRLPLVKSINTSGHKYGLVYPGIGWCIWRSQEDLPKELVFNIDYLGGAFPTFTLNFSKSSGMVIAQYYNFIRLGQEGYTDIMKTCQTNALILEKWLLDTGYFKVISDVSKGLPLVAVSLKEGLPFHETDLSAKVRQRGWIIPAYPLPKGAENTHVIRIVVRESHSEDLCETLVRDLVWAIETLSKEREEHSSTKKGKPAPEHEHIHKKKHTYRRPC